MIRKWEQPLFKKVTNVNHYLLSKDYKPMLGFINISIKQRKKHIDLIKERFPNHEELDIIYRPNYVWGILQEPNLEIWYKPLKEVL